MTSRLGGSTLDELLEEVLADDEATGSETVIPALQKLNQDQREWLDRWTVEGYEDRQDLLFSLHQMQFWSLGRVPDGWFVHVCSRPVPLSILIISDKRYEWRDDPVSQHTATEERRVLAAKYIRPAFRAAFRTLRENVQEYTNEAEKIDDPAETKHLAMRPALDELYQNQSQLLGELLDGFDGMHEVDDWLSRLDMGTLGELQNVEPEFDWKLYNSPVAERVLLEDDPAYVRERELWVATYLLPAFNRATERWASEADEHHEQQDGEKRPSRTM